MRKDTTDVNTVQIARPVLQAYADPEPEGINMMAQVVANYSEQHIPHSYPVGMFGASHDSPDKVTKHLLQSW